jgi:hypothetical protein
MSPVLDSWGCLQQVYPPRLIVCNVILCVCIACDLQVFVNCEINQPILNMYMRVTQFAPAPATWPVAQVGSLFSAWHKMKVDYPYNINVHMSENFFSPQVQNKPHHGWRKYEFILEHNAVAKKSHDHFNPLQPGGFLKAWMWATFNFFRSLLQELHRFTDWT